MSKEMDLGTFNIVFSNFYVESALYIYTRQRKIHLTYLKLVLKNRLLSFLCCLRTAPQLRLLCDGWDPKIRV